MNIPDINQVRKQTADSGEEITQQWVNKLSNAISNGIWQEAKGGKTEYDYMFVPENISFKKEALRRVEAAFEKAGYVVTRPDYGPIREDVLRFSWAKENH